MWSPKGTTLRVIRCPTLQASQFLFPGQRSDTFLTDHVALSDQAQVTLQLRVRLSDLVKRFLAGPPFLGARKFFSTGLEPTFLGLECVKSQIRVEIGDFFQLFAAGFEK